MAAARGSLVGRLAIVTGKLLFFDAKRRGEDFSQGLHGYFFFSTKTIFRFHAIHILFRWIVWANVWKSPQKTLQISQIKATITKPFQSRLTILVVCNVGKETCQKVCCHWKFSVGFVLDSTKCRLQIADWPQTTVFRLKKQWDYCFHVFMSMVKTMVCSSLQSAFCTDRFLFCLFSCFHCCCACTELTRSVTMQNDSWYVTILRIWWKVRSQIEVHRYPPTEAQSSVALELWNFT